MSEVSRLNGMDQRTRQEQRTIDAVTVDLLRRPDEGWGLKIQGKGPCFIEKVKPGGPADYAGLQAGDCIIQVNGAGVLHNLFEKIFKLVRLLKNLFDEKFYALLTSKSPQ